MRFHFVRLTTLLVVLAAALLMMPHPAQAAGFTVYLTFDDGPYAGRTDAVLDVLAKYHVHATFFVEGGHIARGNYTQVQRVIREGHHLGNHMWLHFRDIMFGAHPSTEKMQTQFNMTEDIIHKALGDDLWAIYQRQPRLFRWPGGSPAPMPGMPNVISYNWQVTAGDDVPGNSTVSRILNSVLYGYPPEHYYGVYAWGDGAIVLFHDPARITAKALPAIIENLQAHGATFGMLPRPGDQPGVVIGVIGGVPPCARQPGNCGAQNSAGFLPPHHTGE